MYVKLFATGGYLTFWDCFVLIIKKHRSSSLTPRSEHLFKDITYVHIYNITLYPLHHVNYTPVKFEVSTCKA